MRALLRVYSLKRITDLGQSSRGSHNARSVPDTRAGDLERSDLRTPDPSRPPATSARRDQEFITKSGAFAGIDTIWPIRSIRKAYRSALTHLGTALHRCMGLSLI